MSNGRTYVEWRLREWSEHRPVLLEGYTGAEGENTSILGRLIEEGPSAFTRAGNAGDGGMYERAMRCGVAIRAMRRVAQVEAVYRGLPVEYAELLALEFLQGAGRVRGCEHLGIGKGEWYRRRGEALGYVRGRLEAATA